MDNYIVVTTLCDKIEIAHKIQEILLNKKLIAGCQIFERESTYWWDGKIEKAHKYHLEKVLVTPATILYFYTKIPSFLKKK